MQLRTRKDVCRFDKGEVPGAYGECGSWPEITRGLLSPQMELLPAPSSVGFDDAYDLLRRPVRWGAGCLIWARPRLREWFAVTEAPAPRRALTSGRVDTRRMRRTGILSGARKAGSRFSIFTRPRGTTRVAGTAMGLSTPHANSAGRIERSSPRN